MVELKWVKGEVPKDLKIKQVYAVAFDDYGRILIKINGLDYNLVGGKPEKFDKSRVDTLTREFIEEVNIKLKNIYMLGYQTVSGDGDEPTYAQVRMIAQIDEVYENRPDLDGGQLYKRLLTTPDRAIKYLNWKDVGTALINDATSLANEKFTFKEIRTDEEYL